MFILQYIYIYHIYIYTIICIYIYTIIYILSYIYIYMCIYVYTYICVYIYIHIILHIIHITYYTSHILDIIYTQYIYIYSNIYTRTAGLAEISHGWRNKAPHHTASWASRPPWRFLSSRCSFRIRSILPAVPGCAEDVPRQTAT